MIRTKLCDLLGIKHPTVLPHLMRNPGPLVRITALAGISYPSGTGRTNGNENTYFMSLRVLPRRTKESELWGLYVMRSPRRPDTSGLLAMIFPSS